jgi:hypothetical protein
MADQNVSGLDEAPALFSRTTDAGSSWEAPRVIYAEPGARTIGPVTVVLPNGDLVTTFYRRLPGASGRETADIALVRSTDRGLSWSPAVRVSDILVTPLVDPFSTYPIQPNTDLIVAPSVAVDRTTGRIAIVWMDGRFSDGERNDIAYAESLDGGRSWTRPIQVNRSPGPGPAFIPTIAVMPNGTTGVSFYDLRNASPSSAGIPTDLWLTACSAACGGPAGWSERHVAGPFDLQRAPFGRGFAVGDYAGLVGGRDGFKLLNVLTNPPGSATISDAYFFDVPVGR